MACAIGDGTAPDRRQQILGETMTGVLALVSPHTISAGVTAIRMKGKVIKANLGDIASVESTT